jgi:hypothetical protein
MNSVVGRPGKGLDGGGMFRQILRQLRTRCGEWDYRFIVLGDERGPGLIPGARTITGPSPD